MGEMCRRYSVGIDKKGEISCGGDVHEVQWWKR